MNDFLCTARVGGKVTEGPLLAQLFWLIQKGIEITLVIPYTLIQKADDGRGVPYIVQGILIQQNQVGILIPGVVEAVRFSNAKEGCRVDGGGLQGGVWRQSTLDQVFEVRMQGEP